MSTDDLITNPQRSVAHLISFGFGGIFWIAKRIWNGWNFEKWVHAVISILIADGHSYVGSSQRMSLMDSYITEFTQVRIIILAEDLCGGAANYTLSVGHGTMMFSRSTGLKERRN